MSASNNAPDSTWNVGYFSTFSEIAGTKVSLDQFMRELCTFRRSDVIEWAGTLLQIVSAPFGQTVEVQEELIGLCLDGTLAINASRIVHGDGRQVVFHRRQLWLLIQFASIVCDENGIPIANLCNTIGRLCLIASDCLHSIQLAHVSTKVDEKERLEWQAALLISIAEVMPDAHNLARAKSFWFDSIVDSNVQKLLEKCDVHDSLDAVFLSQCGLSLSEAFFALVTIYKYLTARAKDRPITPILLSSEGTWWGAVPLDTRSHVLKMLSVTIDKFPAYLFGNPRQSWATDFSTLMARPLIESKSGHYVCPDVGYLRTFFVDAIYWLLDGALPGKEWGNAFGAIYEWYVTQVLSSSMRQRPETHPMYFETVNFKGTIEQVCDGLMVSDNIAFLFEFKGTRLTTRQKAGVSVEETMESIRKSVASGKTGVGQLAKSITRILRGEVVVTGETVLEIKSKSLIVPILVWYEESASNVPTRLFLDEVFIALLKEQNIDPARTGPVLLFSTHDVELFEQCSHFERPDALLKRFCDFVFAHPADPRCIFLRFAYSTFKGKVQPKGFIGENVDRLFQNIKDEHARRTDADSDNR